jgi:para-aminobenzoate synthetase component 1
MTEASPSAKLIGGGAVRRNASPAPCGPLNLIAEVRVLVLIEELENPGPPAALFELFRPEPGSFFLDSAMDAQKLGRYSFMGSDPFLRFSSRGDKIEIVADGVRTARHDNPFDTLGRYLETYRLNKQDAPIPLVGGAVGYLSYDLCHFIERLPSTAVDDLQVDESHFGFYDLILAYDNLLHRAFVVSTGFPELDERRRLSRARDRMDRFKSRFWSPNWSRMEPTPPTIPKDRKIDLRRNFTFEAYVRAVEKARQYIIDGDIFEVNLSQRFEADLCVQPFDLYLRLRHLNPAPFAAYIELGDVVLASSSPERFLRLDDDLVETRPIKGTMARGKTAEEDRLRALALKHSVKDHAENMMIVDLSRNDLGRVCRYGSIQVTELAILETFPTVFHLTSTVVGRLRAGVSGTDLLKAAFPGGSITGAPKVRAMEIIDELEPTRRSVYTGSIGYFSFDGSLDLNIAIRTFLIKRNKVYFQAGGAIVYDSKPEAEYQETLDKAQALINALNAADI